MISGDDFVSKKRYTISDLADQFGVSISTISKALNGRPGVRPELREQIQEFCKEIDYQPDSIARGLTKGRLNIIGIMFQDVRNSFCADLAFQIQQGLHECGYMTAIFNSELDEKKELEYIDMAVNFRFAGLIVMTSHSEAVEHKLHNTPLPILLMNRFYDHIDGDMILMDNFQAGYMAAKYLVDLGHKRFAFISGQSSSQTFRQRYSGFLQAMENCHLPFNPDAGAFASDRRTDDAEWLPESFYESGQMPTAVITSHDMLAISFIEQCKLRGLHVPKDLSVVGIDNIRISALQGISLTTIDQSIHTMSEHAIRLILRRIRNPEAAPEHIIMEPKLIARSTTSKPMDGNNSKK